MRSFPFISILLIIASGLCFVMFIMFNYAYNNPDNGLFNILEERSNNWDSNTLKTWYGTRVDHIQAGFGFAGLFLLSLGILVAVVKSFGSISPQE